AEERALNVLDVSMPVTCAARLGLRALGRTAARTRRARHGGADLGLVCHADRALREFDVDAEQRVLTALRARPWPAAGVLPEERVHDVVEAEALTESPTGTAQGVAATVVRCALLRIRQHFV